MLSGGKVILVISPQPWGKMFVSKHHYALELARKGNIVYFLQPPQKGQVTVSVEVSALCDNLFLISNSLYFPYILKFHAKWLFDFLMRWHVRQLVQAIGREIDIVWSFDLGNLYPLGLFRDSFRIFHPVDEPADQEAVKAAEHADLVMSVTKEILQKYSGVKGPKFLVNHGVDEAFLRTDTLRISLGNPAHVGVSGNFLRGDIDRETLLFIVRNNDDVYFEFWGNYQNSGNLGGDNDETAKAFISALKDCKNVILHGPVDTASLAQGFARMDAFLICYDVKRDQSKGTNYHKIMEYLASGKSILSNNVTAYEGEKDLVYMVKSREDNRELPHLFSTILSNLELYNSPDRRQKRIEYAKRNTYSRKISEVDEILRQMLNEVNKG